MRYLRPNLITIICVYHFLFGLLFLASRLLGAYRLVTGADAYLISSLSQTSGTSESELILSYSLQLAFGLALCLGYICGTVGLWRLESWGLYLLGGSLLLIFVFRCVDLDAIVWLSHLVTVVAAWYYLKFMRKAAARHNFINPGLRASTTFKRNR